MNQSFEHRLVHGVKLLRATLQLADLVNMQAFILISTDYFFFVIMSLWSLLTGEITCTQSLFSTGNTWHFKIVAATSPAYMEVQWNVIVTVNVTSPNK